MSWQMKMVVSRKNAAAASSARPLPNPLSLPNRWQVRIVHQHLSAPELCDTGFGNGLADCFSWLCQEEPCSSAAAGSVSAVAPKSSEQLGLGSYSHTLTHKRRAPFTLAPNNLLSQMIGSYSGFCLLIEEPEIKDGAQIE